MTSRLVSSLLVVCSPCALQQCTKSRNLAKNLTGVKSGTTCHKWMDARPARTVYEIQYAPS